MLLSDSTRNATLKTLWIPYMEKSSTDEKSECRWQNTEDHQSLTSRGIVTETRTRTTAARDIVHVQGLPDAEHAGPVPDHLVIAAPDHIPAHHAELVKVTHSHQGSKIAVPIPEVHVVKDLVQDHVRSQAQNQGSLVPGPALALNLLQDHQRIKSQDLVLGLPSKEGPQLQTRGTKKAMERMMALPITTSVISMMEQKTMLTIELSILVFL